MNQRPSQFSDGNLDKDVILEALIKHKKKPIQNESVSYQEPPVGIEPTTY